MRGIRSRLTPEAEDAAYAERIAAAESSFALAESAQSGNVAKRTQHLMISYASDCKRELVVDLELSLRDLGYEVYRNDVGSAVVGPITAGNFSKKMPEAVDASHTIIVCVSPQYKEDVNCLAEAKYIMGRLHVCDLKVIFLMLDPKFTTVSRPPIDGWLSFFVGTEVGYPLWDRLMVITTTREIAKHIGDNCRSSAAQTMTKIMNIDVQNEGSILSCFPYNILFSPSKFYGLCVTYSQVVTEQLTTQQPGQ